MSKRDIVKNDIILIAVLLTSALLLMLIFNTGGRQEGNTVIITVDDKLYKKIEFTPETDEEIVIENNGHKNILLIKDGKVDMIYSDCPNQLCVNQKPVEFNNGQIVCLPNKVVVKVINDKKDEVDAVSY